MRTRDEYAPVLALFAVTREQAESLEPSSVVPGMFALEVVDDVSPQHGRFVATYWESVEAFDARARSSGAAYAELPAFLMELPPGFGTETATFRTELPLACHLAASPGCCVAALAPDGTLFACDDAFCRLVGRGRERLAGQSLWPLLVDPDAAALRRWMQDPAAPSAPRKLNFVDEAGVPHTLTCRAIRGRKVLLLLGERDFEKETEFEQMVIHLNNEHAVLSRENARKTKELAKAMRTLRETQAVLIHTEKMASLGQMTAGVAHEINNPLAFVLSNNGTLSRDFEGLLQFVNVIGDALPEIEKKMPGLFDQIAHQARAIRLDHLVEAVPRKLSANDEGLKRIQQLVLDLRKFSRLDEAERKPIDLADSLTASLRFLEPLRTEHGVTLSTDFAALPPTVCAPAAVNHAVSNLVANAIQASKKGASVRVRSFQEGRWHVVQVSDEGTGIPKEIRDKVFNPFFTTKPVGVGTGLGLSIAYQIASAHEGRVEIDSEIGRGTTVTLYLPAGDTEGDGSGG